MYLASAVGSIRIKSELTVSLSIVFEEKLAYDAVMPKSLTTCGFSEDQTQQFNLKVKMRLIGEDDFLVKILIFLQEIFGSVSEVKMHRMVTRLPFMD